MSSDALFCIGLVALLVTIGCATLAVQLLKDQDTALGVAVVVVALLAGWLTMHTFGIAEDRRSDKATECLRDGGLPIYPDRWTIECVRR